MSEWRQIQLHYVYVKNKKAESKPCEMNDHIKNN